MRHFSGSENFLWAVGFSLNFALAFVLVLRGRWRQFPVFTIWIVFMTARSIILFAAHQEDSNYWYTLVWTIGFGLDFALQMGVVAEIARIVLRPTGTWVSDARAYFTTASVVGILVATLFAWWIKPSTSHVREAWQMRSNLFTSMVICQLFVAMSLAANRVGLAWRSHVMAIGQGLTLWSCTMVIKDALQSAHSTQLLHLPLNSIGVTYDIAIAWIIVELSRNEPERKPISSDLREYILALHKRVEYDLQRIDARH
jgi:hypothetical protein